MESKQEQEQEKITILRKAIKQLIDQDKERCNDDVDNEPDHHHHRLLSNLLSQVESLEIENGRTSTEVQPSEEVFVLPQPNKEEVESSHHEQGRRRRDEEIIKELRKVKRQNFITHCLLSAMFVLTIAWQLSEVSLILKVKESINNPVRSIGRMFTGIFKKPPALVPVSADQQDDDNNKPKQGQNTIIQTSVPGIIVPKLPSVNLPSLDFDFDRD